MARSWNRYTKVPAGVPAVIAVISLLTTAPDARQDETPAPPALEQETDTRPGEKTQDPPDGIPILDDAVREAIGLANQGKYDAAITEVESLRSQHPDDPRLPMFLVRLLNARVTELLETGDRAAADTYITRSATLARDIVSGTEPEQLADVKSFLSATIYNEACSLALDNQPKQAMARLQEAFEWGYEDFEFAASDPDLSTVSDSDAFRTLLETHRQLLVERYTRETASELAEFQTYEFDFEVPTLDKETIALSDYKGKVLIVDFWGTWCAPCRAEIPSLVKLKQQHGASGLDVIGLTYERGETDEQNVENVKAFQEEFEVNYSLVMGTDEILDQIPEFQGYPTTLFVDRTGTVRLQLVGLHSFEKLETICKALLAEEAPTND